MLALFPLDVVLFPGAPLPLHIFEPRYKEMISECLEQKRPFGMVRAQKDSLAEVGCTAVILNVLKKYEDHRSAADFSQRILLGAHHAKRPLLRQALANHFFVARLKDMQRQRSAGEEHHLQRKDSQYGHGNILIASSQYLVLSTWYLAPAISSASGTQHPLTTRGHPAIMKAHA